MDSLSCIIKLTTFRVIVPRILLLALAGLAVPWYFNAVYFLSGGSVAPDRFWADAMVNPLTSAITVDVYLAALVFSGAPSRGGGLERGIGWMLVGLPAICAELIADPVLARLHGDAFSWRGARFPRQ